MGTLEPSSTFYLCLRRQRISRCYNFGSSFFVNFFIMAKFLVGIVLVVTVLVLAVSALASPLGDEAIKKAIEAQRMAAQAPEVPVKTPEAETPTDSLEYIKVLITLLQK